MHWFTFRFRLFELNCWLVSRTSIAGMFISSNYAWQASIDTPSTKKSTKKTNRTTARSTIVSRISLTTIQTNDNDQTSASTVPTEVRNISSSSPPSRVNSTGESYLSIRNTVYISLISSLALLSISIIAAYCILTYLNQYMNKKKKSGRAALFLNRASLMTSVGSNSDASILVGPMYRVTTPNNNPPTMIIDTTMPRRSSTDSIPLFRY